MRPAYRSVPGLAHGRYTQRGDLHRLASRNLLWPFDSEASDAATLLGQQEA